MTTTREQAIEMMKKAKADNDYEMANICVEYVLWLDRKAGK